MGKLQGVLLVFKKMNIGYEKCGMILYNGSGHEGAAVLFPGFAIKL